MSILEFVWKNYNFYSSLKKKKWEREREKERKHDYVKNPHLFFEKISNLEKLIQIKIY